MPILNNAFNSILVFRIPYDSLYFIITILGLWLFTGLFAGLYPALYLSGLKPALIFRGNSAPGGKIFIRKALLTLQFVFSALFVFLSVVMYNQIQYIAHADLGLKIKQVMEFPLTSEIIKHYNAFTDDLKKISGVEVVTCSESEPTCIMNSTSDPAWEGKPADLTDMYETVSVGDDFLKAFNIKLLKGKDFIAGDTTGNSFIVNEKMEKIINQSHPGDIVGMGLNWNGINGQIVGVVKDFHTHSFNSAMQPLIIRKNSNNMNYCFIRFDAEKLKSIIASASSVFSKYENEYPLQYKFMDSEYIKREVDAAVFVSLFSLFAVVAVIISCLGLFGLTAFSIQQKRKEIGIRKVLGASVKSVLVLLTKSMLWTIFTGAVIALPVGYYLSGQLLQLFVYRTNIGAGTFMLTIGIVVFFAILTVIFQVIKAALANPVDSIKYE
jgi:ABC-type antimicrobial peptide transport system permease subunit